jgi:hypothetical protein
MAQKPFRICKKPGCTALVKSGYCEKHSFILNENKRESFDNLDSKKSDRAIQFYRSAAWTQKSKEHRASEPLCRKCKEIGIVTVGELVHHEPDLEYLFDNNLDPLDDQYLETICIPHHQKILKSKNNSHTQ